MFRLKLLKNVKGVVFIVVMASSMIMILVAVSASNMLLQDAHMIRRLKSSVIAKYVAEGGISVWLPALYDTAVASGLAAFGPTSAVALGDGAFSVALTRSGARWLLTSTGTFRGVSQEASVEIRELYPAAMKFALATGGDISIKAVSGSVTIQGDIHANGDLLLSEQGSPTTIQVVADSASGATGKATSGSAYTVSGNVTIADSANSGGSKPQIPMPTFPFAFFSVVAQASGNYYSGSKSFSSADYPITGGAAGITYVNGDVSFTGAATITGGFVAAGDIELNNGNSITQTQDSGNAYPIFMCNGALCKLYGNFNTNQGNLVYATNLIKIRTPGGGTSVLGCVIAGGDMDIVANNNTLLRYSQVLAPQVVPGGLEVVNWSK